MVWTSIVVCVALLVFGCVYSYFKYDQLKDAPEAEGSWFDQGREKNSLLHLWQ